MSHSSKRIQVQRSRVEEFKIQDSRHHQKNTDSSYSKNWALELPLSVEGAYLADSRIGQFCRSDELVPWIVIPIIHVAGVNLLGKGLHNLAVIARRAEEYLK